MVTNKTIKKENDNTQKNYVSNIEFTKISHNAKFSTFKHRTTLETLKYFIV